MPKSEHPKPEQCQNPNFFVFGCIWFGFRTFGLIRNDFMVRILDIIYINPENVQNPNVQTNMFGFQTDRAKTSEIRTFWFRFQTFLKSEYFYNRTEVICLKSGLVRISAFHCSLSPTCSKHLKKTGTFHMNDVNLVFCFKVCNLIIHVTRLS